MHRIEVGQTLIELVVVIAVAAVVVGALTFATIASIRNASFAKNSAQATKLAQEGLEKVRTGRDRDAAIYLGTSSTTWKNNSLWSPITNLCGLTPCYFQLFNGVDLLLVGNGANFNFDFAEQLGLFRRAIILSDDSNFAVEKIVTAIVKWSDFSGTHESRLTTILRKP